MPATTAARALSSNESSGSLELPTAPDDAADKLDSAIQPVLEEPSEVPVGCGADSAVDPLLLLLAAVDPADEVPVDCDEEEAARAVELVLWFMIAMEDSEDVGPLGVAVEGPLSDDNEIAVAEVAEEGDGTPEDDDRAERTEEGGEAE